MQTADSIWQNAQWIWDRNKSVQDDRLIFSTSFTAKKKLKNLTMHIACDSKYWLWLNNKLIVFDGQLRRGPNPHDSYYDTLNLAEHIRVGTNNIRIMVWYWGRSSFSHNDSGMAGLLVSAYDNLKRSSVSLTSQVDWQVTRPSAYQWSEAFPVDGTGEANYRLSERPVIYDARISDQDVPRNCLSALGPAGIFPWGRLHPNPMPFMQDFGLKQFKNREIIPAKIAAGKKIKLVLELGKNIQYHPHFSVAAAAGAQIKFRPLHLGDMRESVPHDIYICKDGKQSFEFLQWMSGQQIECIIHNKTKKPLTIHKLKFRQTGYPQKPIGRFKTNDKALNTLFDKSVNTLHVCARDNWMDCPCRERAMWGDFAAEMTPASYVDVSYNALSQKCYQVWMDWQWDNGVLCIPVPGIYRSELPGQQFYLFGGIMELYQLTGDPVLLEAACKAFVRYSEHLQCAIDQDGFLNLDKWDPSVHAWLWIDWGTFEKDKIGRSSVMNAAYAYALKAMIEAGKLVRFPQKHIKEWRKQYNTIRKQFDAVYWDNVKKGYRVTDVPGRKINALEERASALAHMAGITMKANRKEASAFLAEEANWASGPFLEYYAGIALCENGLYSEFLNRMRLRFDTMIKDESTTLWEGFPATGTANHAWSAGILYPFNAYIAGIRPAEPGFAKALIAPRPGDLKTINIVADTVRGPIKLDYSSKQIIVETPKNMPFTLDLVIDGTAVKADAKLKVSTCTKKRFIAECSGGKCTVQLQ